MKTFKIGELAILSNRLKIVDKESAHLLDYIGTTITVISDVFIHRIMKCYVHRCETQDGNVFSVVPNVLDKIPPKKEETSSWSEVTKLGWNPTGVRV